MNDDVRLIDDALAGDSDAFGQLVQRHQDRLFNTMARVIGCHQEAEDVVQDTFVQAFLKLDTFRRESAFYTWLYRIAFNISMSRQRRQRPVISIETVRQQSGNEPIEKNEAAEERMLRLERADQVQEALESLAQEHRAILVLREMDGLCYDSIAEVLDLPVGTVRSRLHRARLQMHQRLKEVLQEDH